MAEVGVRRSGGDDEVVVGDLAVGEHHALALHVGGDRFAQDEDTSPPRMVARIGNRLLVLIQWAWSYVTFRRGARLITGRAPSE
jgi:hypothetical protein